MPTQVAKVVIGLIIGLICLLLVIGLETKMFGLIGMETQEKLQAQGQLDAIINSIEKLENFESAHILLQAPKSWFVVAIPAELDSVKSAKKPALFSNKNVLCICPKRRFGGLACEKGICKAIDFPIFKKEDGKENVWIEQITIKDVIITKFTDRYIASETAFIVPINLELSESEKQEFKEVAEIISEKYGKIIEENCKIDKNIIISQIFIESHGDERAVGNAGEVGLMQLMPFTAAAYGLKVYNDLYTVYDSYAEASDEEITNYVEQLKEIAKKGDATEIDERFDAEKNIATGCKYLEELLKDTGSIDLALAAYNAGLSKAKRCTKQECKLPDETITYVNKIIGLATA